MIKLGRDYWSKLLLIGLIFGFVACGSKDEPSKEGDNTPSFPVTTDTTSVLVKNFGFTFIHSSSNWDSAKIEGALSITSRPELFLGNAMQSRIESNPANIETRRSKPNAKPP